MQTMSHCPISFLVRVCRRKVIALLIVAVVLACLTACSQPTPKLDNPSPLAAPPAALKSPVASPTVASSPAFFQLTVLHTNDTWGYLLPCG